MYDVPNRQNYGREFVLKNIVNRRIPIHDWWDEINFDSNTTCAQRDAPTYIYMFLYTKRVWASYEAKLRGF